MRYTTQQRLPLVYDQKFMEWLDVKYDKRDFRKYRQAFIKFHQDHKSTRDIGKVLGCTSTNVSRLIREFKYIINEYLEEQEDE